MATKISMKDIQEGLKYEPPFRSHSGITDDTTDTRVGTMGRVHFPPGSESRAHYHTNGAMVLYILYGRTTVHIGMKRKAYVLESGDFFYAAPGVIHNNCNLSDTETVEAVAHYFGCPHPFKSGKTIVEISSSNGAISKKTEEERVAKVSMKDLPADLDYEPGFRYFHGITDETAGSKVGCLSRVHVPPNSKSRPHYHVKADTAFFCMSGKALFHTGEEKKEYVVEADDFFYVPRGEVQILSNSDGSEPVEGVMALFGCSNPNKSGKIVLA